MRLSYGTEFNNDLGSDTKVLEGALSDLSTLLGGGVEIGDVEDYKHWVGEVEEIRDDVIAMLKDI
jgi:hypothetical protein